MPKQQADFIHVLQKTLEGMPPGERHDYAANLLWQDEKEFQLVLNYWSSRLRAIHMAKLLKPIEPEFQSLWEKYHGAEMVSVI